MTLGRILTPRQMWERAGISAPTAWRLHQRGEGPPRVRLSPGRWGYPEDLLEEWLRERLDRPHAAEATPSAKEEAIRRLHATEVLRDDRDTGAKGGN
jgi:predicted DNA-binding transcriptional regulator AlpA